MTSARQHVVCTQCATINRVPVGSSLMNGKCGSCHLPLAVDVPVDINPGILDRMIAHDAREFVLDVWAPWCGPCRMMAPAYDVAARKFRGRPRFLKLNSEAYPEAATRLNVRGIPAVFLFENGAITDQRSGAMTAPIIVDWLKRFLQAETT